MTFVDHNLNLIGEDIARYNCYTFYILSLHGLGLTLCKNNITINYYTLGKKKKRVSNIKNTSQMNMYVITESK